MVGVFVSHQSKRVKVNWSKIIYDRFCRQGPFATFKLQYDRTCEWTGLKFSNDGKLILLSTNGGALRILDAFKGAVLHNFGVRDNSSCTHRNKKGSGNICSQIMSTRRLNSRENILKKLDLPHLSQLPLQACELLPYVCPCVPSQCLSSPLSESNNS